ncbi:MAG: formyltetrahydrofolate deformylase, partial [Proteobacteria bacterium]
MKKTARLLIACADRSGIVATVTNFLHNHGVNVTSLHEHATAPRGGRFFMRVEFSAPKMDPRCAALGDAFARVVAAPFAMDWRLSLASHRKRMAILVSKQDHALLELLWRHKRGELHADIKLVISNHLDAAGPVSEFDIPYHHVPVTRETKPESEARIRELLGDDMELIVLARYMQVLSEDFVDRYQGRIINIHHSFLPAFVGARPYHQAHARGVKLIGATAHYVTAELDAGPIIDQDVIRVTHRDTARELVRRGRSIEREVLARAVRWHLEDRV